MIFPRICTSSALLDALAARGIREMSVIHGGCESFSPVLGGTDD